MYGVDILNFGLENYNHYKAKNKTLVIRSISFIFSAWRRTFSSLELTRAMGMGLDNLNYRHKFILIKLQTSNWESGMTLMYHALVSCSKSLKNSKCILDF